MFFLIYPRNRSALPQHFDSSDGHYEKNKNCSSKPLNLINSTQGHVIQNYNKAYDRAFSTLCNNDTSPPQTSCDHLEHICTMNRTSMDYPTVYKFLSDNNFTKHMERFRDGNNIVTGKILRWNIADLFNVPQWHATFSDCKLHIMLYTLCVNLHDFRSKLSHLSLFFRLSFLLRSTVV